MKYNDVVVFVRNGVAVNALVVESQIVMGEEHLHLSYLDPERAGHPGMKFKEEFSVPPLTLGAAVGWYQRPVGLGEMLATIAHDNAELTPDDAKTLTELSGSGGLAASASVLPSAADLDAVAAEQRMANLTTNAAHDAATIDVGGSSATAGQEEPTEQSQGPSGGETLPTQATGETALPSGNGPGPLVTFGDYDPNSVAARFVCAAETTPEPQPQVTTEEAQN